MTETESEKEIYTEKLMNMILDLIDDIIIIHDSEHTITWMNRAGEKAFDVSVDKIIGSKCYALFGNSTSCSDCSIDTIMNVGKPTNVVKRRIIPKTGIECECASVPYYEKGKLKLVVQHLRPIEKKE